MIENFILLKIGCEYRFRTLKENIECRIYPAYFTGAGGKSFSYLHFNSIFFTLFFLSFLS